MSWQTPVRIASLGLMAVAGLVAGSRRVVVVGDSMVPALVPGDRLLAIRIPTWWRLAPGALVVVPDPRAGHATYDATPTLLVKRVVATAPGWVTVRGDNVAASTDSRTFGPVARSSVAGVVVYRYAPPGRTGRTR